MGIDDAIFSFLVAGTDIRDPIAEAFGVRPPTGPFLVTAAETSTLDVLSGEMITSIGVRPAPSSLALLPHARLFCCDTFNPRPPLNKIYVKEASVATELSPPSFLCPRLHPSDKSCQIYPSIPHPIHLLVGTSARSAREYCKAVSQPYGLAAVDDADKCTPVSPSIHHTHFTSGKRKSPNIW